MRSVWLCAAVAVLAGCAKPVAVGSLREVRVLCDDAVWRRVGTTLREAVETPIHTVEPETVFSMTRVPAGSFEDERLSANVLFVASLDSPDSVGLLLRKVLTEESQEAVRRGESYVFAERDIWAVGQQVTIVTGSDPDALVGFVRRAGSFLFDTLYGPLAKRAVERAYYRKGNTLLQERLAERYGWSVLVPNPWHTVEPEGERIVYFSKNNPDRHLLIYWAAADTVSLAPDRCVALREDIVWRVYDQDEVDRDRTSVQETRFLGRPALRITGVWQNEKHVMGGPFRTYCFVCPEQNRFYLIDLNVFAPGEEKFPYLAQLEGIADSFSSGRKTRRRDE